MTAQQSNGNGNVFLGSKISLVSRSEIRYEGILYSIDTKQATVALESVRSFGTEGRRQGVDEVLPNDQVFDYIIFRGSDIKDLHVCEAPPAAPSLPSDPAIVSHQRPANAPPRQSLQQQTQQNQQQNQQSQQTQQQTNQQPARPVSPKRETSVNRTEQNSSFNPPAFRGGRGAYRGHRGAHRGSHQGTGAVLVPDAEFDFTAANARFDKTHIMEEPQQQQSIEKGYDKSKSFFDDLSSDVKERQSGQTDRRARQDEDKRSTLEAFGQLSIRGGAGRGRGRGSNSGRGRGSYRGQNRYQHSTGQFAPSSVQQQQPTK